MGEGGLKRHACGPPLPAASAASPSLTLPLVLSRLHAAGARVHDFGKNGVHGVRQQQQQQDERGEESCQEAQ